MEIREAIPAKAMTKREVEIIILEEGPGNKGRMCWYGPEAIESGKDVFRGAQVYANHPSKSQMTDLPERDVRELVGRIKETYITENKGKKQLRGIMKVLEGEQYDWVISLIHESIQSLKEGFAPMAQMSIHADGDVEKRMIEGEQYNYVKKIKSAVSVDVVTKGGIKGAGFTKFVESINGGKFMTRQEERMAQIQKKLAESLNAEDMAFLEAMDQNEGNLREDEDEGGEDEMEQVFVNEDGSCVNEAGEKVDPAEVYAMDEESGEVYSPEELQAAFEQAPAVEEPEDEEEEYAEGDEDEDEEVEEPTRGPRMIARGRDEVPISELATRYPQVANEIDQEEIGVEESDRDVDVVALKFENKLLKSRMIAERKIMESGLPAGFITIDDLLGKTPSDMDRIIESRSLMVENIANLVESSRPVAPPAAPVRTGHNPGVGRRLLSGSVFPTE